jgi:hypothetical protein
MGRTVAEKIIAASLVRGELKKKAPPFRPVADESQNNDPPAGR